ncbi:hypothetical protein ASPFODRAFT_58829 [Aspergillus luchuensis CBS 106.47]|uniref:Uncharacterized protein n=1 Tax=Aspergillus luchuensis (strain CBS 106.47) TaxID=1137211 RepID=A0A1M3TMT0_ASPLC|nr:hypothetical protein ASPFODRAFT_58829 [Aspergillus luchuensis CBS 106.47]
MDTGYEHGRKGEERGGRKLTCNGQYGNAAWTPVMIRRTPPKPARPGAWTGTPIKTPLKPRACLVSARAGIPSFDAPRDLDVKEPHVPHGGDDRPYMSGHLQFNLYHGRHLPIVWHNERKWAP